MRTVADRLKVELKGTTEIRHSGSKGRVREALVMAEVLRRVLPETVGIVHGAEVACGDGTVSAECDLVVYDRDIPPIYRSHAYTVLPIESVLGVIEVKSRLTGQELRSAASNLHEIKRMERMAISRDPGDFRRVRRYGRDWDIPPVSTYVVAFDSIDLRNLAGHLKDAEDGWPRWECLDAAYVLWKGCLSNAHSVRNQRLVIESVSDEGMVFAMVIEFLNHFQRGLHPRFNPGPYLGESELGIVACAFGGWNEDGSQA